MSETFILSQIMGLIDAGCDVQVFADGRDFSGPELSATLRDRVRYFGLPFKKTRELVGIRKAGLASPDTRPRRGARAPASSIGRLARLRLMLEGRAFKPDSRFDLIHAHFGPNGVRAVRLRSMGVISGPIVTSFYGYDVGRHWVRSGYDQLFDEGDRFIALSEHMRDQLIRLGCPADRVIVHRLAVDLDQLTVAPRQPDDVLKIISVARLVEKKGIEFGLRAVAEVLRRNIPVRYTIVGDGPLRERLETLSRELGIAPMVRFTGPVPHASVARMLHDADVLLAPSVEAPDGDVEGTPVAILEASASGIPVVATRHAGIPEIVTDGESGFLAEERDVDGLAGYIARLSESAALRERMGNAGKAIVAEKHDMRRLNVELLALYREVCGR